MRPASVETHDLRHDLEHEAQSLWRNACGPLYAMYSIGPKKVLEECEDYEISSLLRYDILGLATVVNRQFAS
jgi:hypothetical protein